MPQLPPAEELITVLINGVTGFPQDFALVLDDYHAIKEPAIHTALAYLLDHLPPKMHLVILTRSDPPLHLAKLRARGELVELRADDLRFTSEETASFLNVVMGLNLSAENVRALDQRTEGWIVGLQIAAIAMQAVLATQATLSMQGKADATAFIRGFTGSHRYVLDYFAEEVLQQQPEAIQTFLLQTSILDQLSGPLCDAVLGVTHNSAQVLVDLERRNLFLIPLDDEQQWYRYHHLFADLLFQRLKQTQPEMVNELYARAGVWLEQNGYLENAVGYALKARNYELATRLLNQIKNNLWGRGEIRILLKWLNTLPEELARSQTELCLAYAACLTIAGYFDAAEKWLRLAEDRFGALAASDPHTVLRAMMIPLYRSVNARYHGDFSGAIGLCRWALEQVPNREVRFMGVALLFLGQAHFYAGNTLTAEQVLSDAIQSNLASGHMEAYLNACHHLAQLRVLQGRLHEARIIYEQAALVASEQGTPIYAGTEHACLGDLKREWNDLEAAAMDIQRGIELAEAGDHIMFLTDVYLAGVRLALAQKDWETAWSYLQKADRVAHRCPTSIEIKLLQTWQARLHLAQGNLAEAGLWAEPLGAEPLGAEMKRAEIAGPFDPQHEFALLTLARVWLAQGKTDQAASLLERIRIGAEAAGRGGRALEAQLLQALAEQAAGKEMRAVEKFTQVLARAEPEGYVRLFIEESAPVAKLLYKAITQTETHLLDHTKRDYAKRDYAERLMAAYFHEEAERQVLQAKTLQGDALIKPLSEREREVLRLVAAGKTDLEIAAELYLAIGTVKRHNVNIYTKLDVKNRTEAVAKARQLGLL